MAISRKGRRRITIVVIASVAILLVGSALYVGRGIYKDRSVAAAYEESLVAYAEGRYADAIRGFSDYVARNPTDIDALLKFADTRLKVATADGGHLRFAASIYQQVLRQNPDNLPALEGQLQLYRQLGRRIELSDAARRIIGLDPSHTAALEAMVKAPLCT